MRIPMWVKRVIKPARIVRIQRTLGQRKRGTIRILNVGCGPNVMYTKPYFNVQEYHGIDRGMRPGFEGRERTGNMDKLFCMDLNTGTGRDPGCGHYDLIILSHVIEHLSNGLELIGQISTQGGSARLHLHRVAQHADDKLPLCARFHELLRRPNAQATLFRPSYPDAAKLRSACDARGLQVELAPGFSGTPGITLSEPFLLLAV